MPTGDWMMENAAAPLRRWLKTSKIGRTAKQKDLRTMFPEATAGQLQIMNEVRPFTMTSWERVWALLQAVGYVHARRIEGDIVECGVWRGGSSMAAARALLLAGDAARQLWLFDTYAGMNKPTADDRRIRSDEPALGKWLETSTAQDGSDWCKASLEDVRDNMKRTGYPEDRIRMVAGRVEETLLDPANIPAKIAILRLDTDWYESTRMELEYLFERVSPGGIVILDDYGHWAGAKKAVDESLATQPPYFMNRIDASGRIMVKI
jgi:O-methyltransferase